MKNLLTLATLAVAVSPAVAQVPVFGQCGGEDYTGSTVCAAGSTCVFENPFFSQCIPGTATATTTTSTVATTTSTAPPTSSSCANRTKFKFFGVNESGAEFGSATIPGTWGIDFIFPAPSSIDYFVGQGFNFFRVPFQMERMVPPAGGMTGPFSEAYLANYTAIINYITSKGAFAAIDPHNFMIYNGAEISSTSDFQTFWTNLAGQFKSNPNVIFDVMNEPNTIPASTAFALNQAAVNGIRASGATTQLILVEGTAWTGAWTWVSSGNSAVFGAIKDPNNNVAIEMHQYLDSDGSGTSDVCVSSTIGAERLADATAWLQANNLKGFLGERSVQEAMQIASVSAAVSGAMCAMQQSGVWIGASWWAAGPWWPSNYFTLIEPPNGIIIQEMLPQALLPYL
ncbi:Glycoside hydrolase family 5 protein [Mycena sanguinolenta]|uniref:cellulase n=1 Tax=Mycena sanguinolenta TaxID=230812 RepID=A0A8H6ZDD0_9AGAR|nr:Glycoside hydrolase family 5 protein [Mycena sanguinolenta]